MAIWRITCRLDGPGQGGPKFNVFHARADDSVPSPVSSYLDALAAFYSAMDTVYAAPTTVTVGDTVVDVETDENVEAEPQTIGLGAGTSNQAPELLQVVIPWRTSLRARRGSGRTFIGPLGSTIVSSDGNPDGSSLTTIGAAADGLVSASQDIVAGAFGVWGYESAAPDTGRPEDSPRLLRDWVGRGALRTNGFSYLSSRRD